MSKTGIEANKLVPDTLILQLGYILCSVPAWKSYKLRVMVFVEYEAEVDEERARVKALLEKLRIDAEIKVFWLASGEIKTYKVIIHGSCDDTEKERLVDQCLKDEEWWDELQQYRGKAPSETTPNDLMSLAHTLEAGTGWGSLKFDRHGSREDNNRRRLSVTDMMEFPKRPTVSRLSRLGVNVGIHTQNLPTNVFVSDSSSESGESGSGSLSSDDEHGADFNDSDGDGSNMGGYEGDESRPLLIVPPRRKSFGDTLCRPGLVQHHVERQLKLAEELGTTALNYGSIYSTKLPTQDSSKSRKALQLTALDGLQRCTVSPVSKIPGLEGGSSQQQPQQQPLSRQGSALKFSSRPVPETKITAGEEKGPTITFTETGAPTPKQSSLSRQSSAGQERRPGMSRQNSTGTGNDGVTSPKRPSLSRQSSTNRFSSRPMPETRVTTEDAQPKISFAQPALQEGMSPARSRVHSRKNSGYAKFGPESTAISIPEMIESYHFEPKQEDSGSTYSTQSMPLSFNDLPSRAQHLILNEMMRRESVDTTVLLTTLPIPEEGVSGSEAESIRYLSDVEVLCEGLPPTLLVLSNNMTVTVSL